ncbi:DUF5624 domain-containing protein [Streptomyces chartreusis]|uniref:DUF5624 domain-containing protein n=1 Tax=Streptomyces TaxID=1883 RepID=UPI00034E8E90|nr:DUF5624 domain-containing protein [Streptomyces sp. HGB0020]EPD57769.1 hypothetical protein HMPREF1211_06107 [Streptomyces sp. HGB0020]
MSAHESPELIDLFTAYTAAPDSIGAQLRRSAADTHAVDPLLVVTHADMALYPGNGQPPTILGFRLSTRGFKELAGVSHLGCALASLVELSESGREDLWRPAAELLLRRLHASRRANSPELWRETIAAVAFRGREEAIAAMVDYACALTEDYLTRALADPSMLNHRTLREQYLEDGPHLAVSFNRIMVATFFLVGMDNAHRLISWCDAQGIDWERTMVVVAGQQGRPTAGVTWQTSSVASLIIAASRHKLPLNRLYMAPHAKVFATPVDGDLTEVEALEPVMRQLWAGIRITVELGGAMFEGYPAFSPGDDDPASFLGQDVSPTSAVITERPRIKDPDDWFALITRLRLVMEDPRQLLSGAVTDFAAESLIAHGNDPLAVTVPGLDGEPYPEWAASQ